MANLKTQLSSFPGVRKTNDLLRTIAGTKYPKTVNALRATDLYNQWWYYSIELLPDLITRGQYEESIPMLPRLMLRECDLSGQDCLDLGSMEGLIPALMVRGGAGRVLATDAVDHCAEKIAALQHYYQVTFEYRNVGLMYELDKKLASERFDLINCSGLLYHVISPFHVLAGIRPLVKRNGLVIVSTNVVQTSDYVMDFNQQGSWQDEVNTFWYVSIPLLDYTLRYLKLAPIDCVYLPHKSIESHIRYVGKRPSGYLSVVCRAVNTPLATPEDGWMAASAARSWEYQGLVDWKRAGGQKVSQIEYRGNKERKYFRSDLASMDLSRAVAELPSLARAERSSDAHVLRLHDLN